MRVTLWGTRGSLADARRRRPRATAATPPASRCAADDGTVLVLDAGTGIRRLGATLLQGRRAASTSCSHISTWTISRGSDSSRRCTTSGMEIHIWGPPHHARRCARAWRRYLSPPFFPVHLRDLPCRLTLHEVPCGDVRHRPLRDRLGARLSSGPDRRLSHRCEGASLAYLPDHEPALGARDVSAGAGLDLGLRACGAASTC